MRDLQGPWLLYDNEVDPYQMRNLVHTAERAGVRDELDALLQKKLQETEDQFLPGATYIKKWGYRVDETGTVPFTD